MVCLAWLFSQVDFDNLRVYLHILQYRYLVLIVLIVFWINFLLGLRLYLLLEKSLDLSLAMVISTLGSSLNLVLPARGGEVLRMVITSRHTSIGSLNILARFLIEKSLDLFFSLLAGALSLWLLGFAPNAIIKQEYSDWRIILCIILFAAAILMLIVWLLIKYKYKFLITCAQKMVSPFHFRYGVKLVNYLKKELPLLSSFLHWRKLRGAIVLTALIWLCFYCYLYIFAGNILTFNISFVASLFLTFAGAMGFFLQIAPSGIGVVHATVTTAMLFLNFPLNEALAFAIVFHLCIIVAQGLSGIMVWIWYSVFYNKKTY